MDEGFCIIEFVDTPRGPLTDFVHLEANGAFSKHCGLPDSINRSARDLIGDEAEEWIATYRQVIDTGEPIHLRGGHWCPTCMIDPATYSATSDLNPFFRQVWKEGTSKADA